MSYVDARAALAPGSADIVHSQRLVQGGENPLGLEEPPLSQGSRCSRPRPRPRGKPGPGAGARCQGRRGRDAPEGLAAPGPGLHLITPPPPCLFPCPIP